MNDFEDDEALARLRAADPAQGAHPDLHRLSERLRGRTPLGSRSRGTADYAHTSDTAVRVADPSVRTGRGGLLVAASVAALALAGGGFAVGATVAGGEDGRSVAGQETDHGSPETLREGDREGTGDAASSEVTTAENYGGDGASGVSPLGPVVPVAGSSLSTERTTGAVLAPADGSPTGAAQALQPYAEALGIAGEVQDYDSGADVVDPADARSLHLYEQGSLQSLDYANPALDPWCQETVEDAARQGYKPFGDQGPQEIECAPQGELPGEEEAIAAARELLAEAGIDDSGYVFSVESQEDWIAEALPGAGEDDAQEGTQDDAAVTAEPPDATGDEEVGAEELLGGGEATEISVLAHDPDLPVADFRTWRFSVTGAGVSYASIQLGNMVQLGDYEVISPVEAVDRANDTRFQSLGVYIPGLPYDGTYEEQWEDPEPLPAVQPGDPIPFPVGEATVTGAELHTGVLSLWDGTEFLVPAWHLTDGAGNSWDVLGLTEDSLDFTP